MEMGATIILAPPDAAYIMDWIGLDCGISEDASRPQRRNPIRKEGTDAGVDG